MRLLKFGIITAIIVVTIVTYLDYGIGAASVVAIVAYEFNRKLARRIDDYSSLREVRKRFVSLDDVIDDYSSRRAAQETTHQPPTEAETPLVPSTMRGAVWGGLAGTVAFALFAAWAPELQNIYMFLLCLVPGALLGAWGLRR